MKGSFNETETNFISQKNIYCGAIKAWLGSNREHLDYLWKKIVKMQVGHQLEIQS